MDKSTEPLEFDQWRRRELQRLLTEHFNLDELRTLCFTLGADFEELGGEGKSGKVRELIAYLQRHGRLADLMVEGAIVRPNLSWPTRASSDSACPYRGMFAFREEDAASFFGRESFTDRLAAAVESQSFVALIGPSGSGKSSVVFAGLIPRLRSNNQWCIAAFRPGNRPFYNLAAVLVALDEGLTSRTARLDETRRLATALGRAEDPLPLADVLHDLLADTGEQSRLLVVADQFEELYTLCHDVDERRRFLDTLLAASASPSARLLLTLRADFLGQALGYRPFANALQDQIILLGSMTVAELRQAITYPARNAGVSFEPGLEDTILRELGDEPGNLPLLQFALTELWNRQQQDKLTHAAYETIGRVEGALAHYADQIYMNLDPAQQTQARRIFTQLVQPGEGTEDTRRLALCTELSADDWQLVQQLADARLVVTGQDNDGRETVEVVHEALIRRWGQLRQWMEEDRAFRAWQERLRYNLRQWEVSSGDEGALLRSASLVEAESWLEKHADSLSPAEKAFIRDSVALARKSERRRRQLFVGVVVAAVIFAIMSFSLYRALANAERQTRIANARAWAAQSSEALNRDLKTSLLRAVQSVNITYQENDPTVAEAYNALYRVLTRENNGVPLGHTASVMSATFSPDGSRVVTASNDSTARLWDANGILIAILEGHTESVHSAAFSPDGTRIVTASSDGTARLWSADGTLVATLEGGHKEPVTSAAFSPDGSRIVTASNDSTARLWDTNGTLIAILEGHMGPVTLAAFSPDGTRIVTTSSDGTARLWEANGTLITTLEGHTETVYSAAFSPDGSRVVTASNDSTARLWSADGVLVTTLEGHTELVRSAAFSPDGTRIVTASWDSTARLWSADGILIAILEGHTEPVHSAAFSSDGTRIVTASSDGTARLWSADGTLVATLEGGHKEPVTSAAFSPDGSRIVTAGFDISAWLWGANGALVTTLEGHTKSVYSAAFNPEGSRIVTASSDGTARLWSAAGTLVATLEGHTGAVRSAAFSSDGTRIVTASWDSTARLWSADGTLLATLEGDTEPVTSAAFSPDESRIVTTNLTTARLWSANGTLLAILEGHTEPVTSAAFSPDGSRIVTANLTTARLWSAGGALIATLEGHTGPVRSTAFSPDGSHIITTSWDSTARLWSADGAFITILHHDHPGLVTSAAFSPDENHIVTTSTEGTAWLWNAEGTLVTTLQGHTESVSSAAFSPDGIHVVTAGFDNTARLWETDGTFITTLEGHLESVNSVTFSPDGTRILTASSDGTARLWVVDIDVLLAEGKRRLFPMLTLEECKEHFPKDCPPGATKVPIP